MDRMRTSLFSILGNLEGASFLDLFSGSGILGVEAASRGASPVLLVEKDPRKRAAILKNISFVETPIELVTAPVERFLRTNRRPWDIVFLDPPFAWEGKEGVLDEAGAPPHMAPGGMVIIHLHSAEKLAVEDRPGLELADRRVYGQSLLLFFRRRESPGGMPGDSPPGTTEDLPQEAPGSLPGEPPGEPGGPGGGSP